MSKANQLTHTPGPWHADRSDMHGNDPKRWSVFATAIGKSFYVASIENGAPGDCLETEEANARLIAAAPELLDALKSMVASYDGLRDSLTSPVVLGKLAKADAAIARAGGWS